MKNLLFTSLGFVSFALGAIGVLLPILPTTPFLLLSGYCFARSSKKFEIWLRKTKLYKFYVEDYAESKTISYDRKKKIIWQIYLLLGLSIFVAPILWVKLALFLLTLFITYYLFRVIPDKKD